MYSSRVSSVAWRRRPVQAAMATVRSSSCRFFVDSPVAEDIMTSTMQFESLPVMPPMDTPSAAAAAADTYVYPLDMAESNFKLYGESNVYSAEDANRIFASGRVRSYDPSVLFAEVRLQEVTPEEARLHGSGEGANASHAALMEKQAAERAAAAQKGSEEETDAVMRSGRDKQGAAGAAAMAAAMLDSRRAADGIAMVPGHPLPVVFPRPDGLPPSLRFVKKFGPGSARQTRSRHRVRRTKSNDEATDDTMYGEVMESEGRVEAHSIQHSVAWKVQVLDEHRRPTAMRPFQHFREVSDLVPERVMRGLELAGFLRPTLLQAASIPQLMQGKDVVAVAPHGSGSTVSYAVPSIAVLVKLKSEAALRPPPAEEEGAESTTKVAAPTVVVVCPDRGTIRRTAAMYASLSGENMRVCSLYGCGTAPVDDEVAQQRAELRDPALACDVLVSSVVGLTEAIGEGIVTLDRTHVLAIDKADSILENKDSDNPEACKVTQLEEIMRAVRENSVPHQLSMWCEHISGETEGLVRRFMSPMVVTVLVSREEHLNANVRQILYALPSKDERLAGVCKLYEQRVIPKRNQVLVYCAFRETAEEVARRLVRELGAPSSLVKYVHSGLRSKKRHEIMDAFRHGDIRILVGTDVATKQLDVPDLEHVINYDLPATTEMYMQRVNQVGRSGRSGTVHTLLAAGDARVPMIANFVAKQTGHQLSPEMQRMVDEVEETGGDDSWETPLVRMHNHAGSTTKWRVRGRKEGLYSIERLTGLQPETDCMPHSKES